MKALVYTGAQDLVYRDDPDPEPADGEILVQVEAVGICGSDMHAYLGHDDRRPPPLILGHEACGRAMTGSRAGERVVINPLVSCGTCENCLGGRANLCTERQIISMPPRQGAFAEYLRIPETNIVPVPDGLKAAPAALTEPIATALHAVNAGERALWRPLGETRVLVIGGGAVGLSAALVVASRGAARVCVAETNPGRRETARAAGGFEVIDPLGQELEKNAFGLVIDAVGGGATRALASKAAAPGGVIVHIGLMNEEEGLDVRKTTLQEITFIGVYTYTMVDFRATLDAMARGVLGDLNWITRRPLADGAEAFRDLYDGKVGEAKVILEP